MLPALTWEPKISLLITQKMTEGRSSPLGATLSLGGTNFSVYSKHATAIDLLLFDCVEDARPARVIRMDSSTNRTYHYWHIFVPGVRAGQIYGYRAEGPTILRVECAPILRKFSSIPMDAPPLFRRITVARLLAEKGYESRYDMSLEILKQLP